MKDFSFFIPAENYTYSFSLPSKIIGREEYVETAGLRHPEFCVQNNAPNYFSLRQAIAKEELWQAVNEFQNDLNQFVNIITSSKREVTHEMLDRALLGICSDHISKCGRLLYYDLLGYVDLATFVDKAIYKGTVESYHSFYRHSVYNALNTFPKNVLFQSPIGGFYSWADVPSR